MRSKLKSGFYVKFLLIALAVILFLMFLTVKGAASYIQKAKENPKKYYKLVPTDHEYVPPKKKSLPDNF